MAYGRLAADFAPPPPPWGDDIPYYWEGEEFVETTGGWVEGTKTGTVTFTKEPNNIRLLSTSINSSGNAVTNNEIDLTNINTLYIEWVNTGNTNVSNGSGFGVYDTKARSVGNSVGLKARLLKNNPFVLGVDTLDVSSVNEGFILFGIYKGDAGSITNDLKVLRLWGE